MSKRKWPKARIVSGGDKCRCGGQLKCTGTPSWQNRWTCIKCGKHVTR